jgi:hypothetical protein
MHVEPTVDAVMLDETSDPLALEGVGLLVGNKDAGRRGRRDRGGNFVKEIPKRVHACGFEPARV